MARALTLPVRLRPGPLLGGTFALFVLQLLTGTSISYALLIALFILVAGIAVNALGGLVTVSGVCVSMLALKTVIISQVAKLCFLQSGDSFLEMPTLTAAVLLAGMIGILAAAGLVKLVPQRRVHFKPITDPYLLLAVAMVSFAIGVGSFLYVGAQGFDAVAEDVRVGGMVGIARQLSTLSPLAVICACAYSITVSDGKRSLGTFGLIVIITQFCFGLLATSKQGMYEPVFYYLLTCIAFRFRFARRHFVTGTAFAVFGVVVLFPLAQIGRNFTRVHSVRENVELTLQLLRTARLDEMREDLAVFNANYERFQYYGRDAGLLDRFSLIANVDRLVAVSVHEGFSGWQTVVHGFQMLPPRFLYPNKPIYGTANFLGHRIGMLGEDDDVTQVTFGFIGESFSALDWPGAFLIPFVLTFFFALVYRRLTGPIYLSVWSVFLIGLFQHVYVEYPISGMTLAIVQLPLVLIAFDVGIMRAARMLLPVARYFGETTVHNRVIETSAPASIAAPPRSPSSKTIATRTSPWKWN
jgi:hypothetical protein